jgi:hypothetical protein
MGRRGDGETGRRGDGEMGRRGDGETLEPVDAETRLETEKRAWEKRSVGETVNLSSYLSPCLRVPASPCPRVSVSPRLRVPASRALPLHAAFLGSVDLGGLRNFAE